MEFRPCIDIHNGKVKQIVGASLQDEGDIAVENFVSERDADFFADFYAEKGQTGGHVIMLNSVDSEYYEATKEQAIKALHAYPNGLQIGGGINASNAAYFISEGASHVIVTSFAFSNGVINYDNLEALKAAVGAEHIVLDISCKKKGDDYFVVTDRWQNFTDEKIDMELLSKLSEYADEFLIHAAHVEGKEAGIDEELIELLSEWDGIPITYAGGIADYDDIIDIRNISRGRINVTIGSALDLFGGPLNFETVIQVVQDV